MGEIKVGILILFYDDLQHIERISSALLEQKYFGFSIYVLDNQPEFNHIQKFTQFTSNIIEVQSNMNIGFAGGNNLLAKKAIDDGCIYLWVLNPDMEPTPDALEHLVDFMKKNDDVGIAGPLVLYGNSKNNPKIQAFGSKADFKTQKKKSLFADALLSHTALPNELRVDMINAGSLFIRSEVIKDSYLFEEQYFMYNDEIDIAKRVRNKGYSIAVISNSVVWHHHDWLPGNTSGFNMMYYYMMRNKMLYFYKFGMPFRCIFELLKQLILCPIVLRFCRKTSSFSLFRFYYKGLFHGLIGVTGKATIKFN